MARLCSAHSPVASMRIRKWSHRCDHFRIRIEATGEWALHSLAIEYYVGSALH